MGYEVHIVRNSDWWDVAVGGGISLEEWEFCVRTDESMRLDHAAETKTDDGEVIRYENPGLAVWVGYSNHNESGNMAWFDFREGRISVKNPDEEILRKMHQLATRLDAKVVGDEEEEYDEAGGIVRAKIRSDQAGKPWWKFW